MPLRKLAAVAEQPEPEEMSGLALSSAELPEAKAEQSEPEAGSGLVVLSVELPEAKEVLPVQVLLQLQASHPHSSSFQYFESKPGRNDSSDRE